MFSKHSGKEPDILLWGQISKYIITTNKLVYKDLRAESKPKEEGILEILFSERILVKLVSKTTKRNTRFSN